MSNKIYIIDTSVCLTDSRCIYHYDDNDIIIPMKVLQEIDKHKKRQDSVGSNARNIIREFDLLRERGCLQDGVNLGPGLGTLRVSRPIVEDIPKDFDPTDPDHLIMTAAISARRMNPDKEIIIASRDINMRVITDALGIISEDYIENQAISSQSELYTGMNDKLVDDHIIDELYSSGRYYLDSGEDLSNSMPNQCYVLKSNIDIKKSVLARFNNGSLKKVVDYSKSGIWGIRPRNKEQAFSIDMLMDPEVPLVSLVGRAGSGKTLMAIAAGIAQTLSDPFKPEIEKRYKRLVVSRPIQPLGKDIGYLPGTMEEKMNPWLKPIQDNLQYILGNDKATLEDYLAKGIIEIEAITYIRGRSISDAYIIIDEAQNLTMHEIKTILTRVGENTKIILTGDIDQIDNMFIDETSNGLVHVVERFKKHDIAGHITLQKGERSALATLASDIL